MAVKKRSVKLVKKDKQGRWRYGGKFTSESHAKKLIRDRKRRVEIKKREKGKPSELKILGRKVTRFSDTHTLYRWKLNEPVETVKDWIKPFVNGVTKYERPYIGTMCHAKFYRADTDQEFWAPAGATPPGRLGDHAHSEFTKWAVKYEGYIMTELTLDIFKAKKRKKAPVNRRRSRH